ncbi:FG-GAP repeat domain-containing protein [Desulfovibrio ferrophilus]|uniref:FG-GAP repeat protein n=1 Tax=Desulfovibrio ferrophilus TaxID=241368 RepID=A0A2Z6AU77_9BACT|nr:VCBS repeat-containing protein [Desulfovibrio ferrophilus]BBD06778.1 FG-GAP repeat protein [Desulfovibrio ferrophilus]
MIDRRMMVLVSLVALSLVLGACTVHMTGTGENSVNATAIPFNKTYDFSTNPSWDPATSGDYGTGLALVDINGDNYPDMVVSSGNDKALQCVQVFYNDKNGNFKTSPDWHSTDRQHHGLLAVGDIDGNGYVDVAVSVFLGNQSEYVGGGAKVYMNHGPPNFLETTPSWQVTGFPSFGLDLGDIDGDGDLDLAVACGEPIPGIESFAKCSFEGQASRVSARNKVNANPDPPFNCQQVVYRNDGGTLGSTPWWKSDDAYVAMACQFADVNMDGLLDLAFPAAPVRVYLGQLDGTLATSPSWQSVDINYYGNGIDFAATMHPSWASRPDTVPTLATSANNYIGNGRGGFSLYRFLDPYIIRYAPHVSVPDWQSAQGGWGSAVLLADLNSDGNLDLVTHRWNEPGRNDLDGTLLVYTGDDAMVSATPQWESDSVSVIEHISASDLNGKDTFYATTTFEVTQDWINDHWLPGQSQVGMHVVYLPHQLVADVFSITKNGQALTARTDYTVVPGRNYVSFNVPLQLNDKVVIAYFSPLNPDLIYTNWNCEKGNYIYYNTNGYK